MAVAVDITDVVSSNVSASMHARHTDDHRESELHSVSQSLSQAQSEAVLLLLTLLVQYTCPDMTVNRKRRRCAPWHVPGGVNFGVNRQHETSRMNIG